MKAHGAGRGRSSFRFSESAAALTGYASCAFPVAVAGGVPHLKTPATRSPPPCPYAAWLAWDRMLTAINRKLADPTEANERAVREASKAYVETTGEVYRW